MKHEQWRIGLAVRLWLEIDERSAQATYSPLPGKDDKNDSREGIDFDGMSPSERFRYNHSRNAVFARIGLKPVYRMSKRTCARRQAKLRALEKEKANLTVAMARFELGMGEVEPELMVPPLVEQDPSADLEIVFPEEYEVYHKKEEEFTTKRDEYIKEFGKGWDVTVEYEVPDIISLCWLELFTCVQHRIPARRCTLCQRYFIVTGRANMRQCPECRKNPAKAWRKANKSTSNEDGSSEEQVTAEYLEGDQ